MKGAGPAVGPAGTDPTWSGLEGFFQPDAASWRSGRTHSSGIVLMGRSGSASNARTNRSRLRENRSIFAYSNRPAGK